MWQRLWKRFRRALWPDLEYWAVAVLGLVLVGLVLAVRALTQGL